METKGTIRCLSCGRKFGDHFEGKLVVKCYNCNTYSSFDTDIPEQKYAMENRRSIYGDLTVPAKIQYM